MGNRRGTVRVRLVLHRSGTLLKVMLIAAIVLSTVTLLRLRLKENQAADQIETLREQAAALEEENRRLEQSIDELGTIRSVERIAQEELELVYPDTIVFRP